jgi:hypothetical protein
MRTILIAGAAAAVLLAATIGFSYAQSAPTKEQEHRAVIDVAAVKLGIDGDALAQALKDARKDLAVKHGLQLGKLVRDELTVAAKALGLADAKALRKELAGSTLTAVAQKHNVAPTTVANAIKADIDAKIDALVTAGKLKADRAAELKTKAHSRVDALMTREFKAK